MREFWERHPDAKGPLLTWEKVVKNADWEKWVDLRSSFGSADRDGSCIIFDIGGNKYRLIGRVFYGNHRVYILKIMTHAEYDRDRWKKECGCHEPQPEKKS